MPAVLERPRTVEAEPPSDKIANISRPAEVAKIEQATAHYDTIALKGFPGSGKSLFGPKIILDAMNKLYPGEHHRVLVGEPRQFLAKGTATKAAGIMKTPLGGDLIGFYHGSDRAMNDKTQIVYTVSGSIKNRLEEDIALPDYDVLCLDEIHLKEGDQTAIRIGLPDTQAARVARGLRPLKIFLMSADVEERDATYHGNSTLIEVQGTKQRHVEQQFLDEVIPQERMAIHVARKAAELIRNPKYAGDLLAFLPGRAELDIAVAEYNRIMQEEENGEYKAFAMTGGGGAANEALQAQLQAGNADKSRKPIAAMVTSVAETGANFDISIVVDSGLDRDKTQNARAGMGHMNTRWTALTNYVQRLGRLGRGDLDGLYFGMYPQADLADPLKHPEVGPSAMEESDLTPIVLSLKKMGKADVYAVNYPDKPSLDQLDRAVKTLAVLGALKPDGTLTPEGEEMTKIPVDYHNARMLAEAKKHGCVEAAAVLAGFLGENIGSVFQPQKRQKRRRGEPQEDPMAKYKKFIVPGSDFLTMINIWNGYISEDPKRRAQWASANGFNPHILDTVSKTKESLAGEQALRGTDLTKQHRVIDVEAQKDEIRKSALAGYADKLFKWDDHQHYSLVQGYRKGVTIVPSSTIGMPGQFISANPRINGKTGATYADMNQVVSNAEYNELKRRIDQIAIDFPAPEQAAVHETERIFAGITSPQQGGEIQTEVPDVYRRAFTTDEEIAHIETVDRQPETHPVPPAQQPVRQEEARRVEALQAEAAAIATESHSDDDEEVQTYHERYQAPQKKSWFSSVKQFFKRFYWTLRK